jgi:hypothetical protein
VTSNHPKRATHHECAVPRREGTLWLWILAQKVAIAARSRRRWMLRFSRTPPPMNDRSAGVTTQRSRSATASGISESARHITSEARPIHGPRAGSARGQRGELTIPSLFVPPHPIEPRR